jgi:regulator of PEP synthase PpsR (kinase-PPPase family)
LRVGLTMDPSILAELRKQRLGKSGWWHSETAYVDSLQVSYEVREARQMYVKHGWPVVDVTMKSVEEIAAKIIQLYVRRTSRKASDRSR